jgi:hypothetical protein
MDLSLRGKQTVTQVQRETHVVRHRSFKDLWVHSRDLESILLPLRDECVDGVLQVTVPRVVLARYHQPSSISHCLSKSHTRGGTSILAENHLPIEDLHGACELHAP